MNTPIADLLGGVPLPATPPNSMNIRPVVIDAARVSVQTPEFPTFAALVTKILSGQPVAEAAPAETGAEAAIDDEEKTETTVENAAAAVTTDHAHEHAHVRPDAALGALRDLVERVAKPVEKLLVESPRVEARAPVPASPLPTSAPVAPALPALSPVPSPSTSSASPAPAPIAAKGMSAEAIRHRATHDPSYIVRDTSVLQPELRSRVERVIERMESEFGHKVTVVETWRSQSRQDVLFEQGRSAPGKVVTWVKHSTHSDGRAADLLVDGRWTNPVAYKRLQEIASEEGLRTLGSRDPGHVELRRPAAAVASAKSRPLIKQAVVPELVSATPDGKSAVPVKAPVLVAQPEHAPRQVAAVADVAKVAQVARIEAPIPAASMPGMRPLVASGDRPATAAGARTAPRVEKRRQTQQAEPASTPTERAHIGPTAQLQPTARTAATTQVNGAELISPADRFERIAMLRDLSDAQPMSSLLLKIDSADGGVDRIRLGLQGNQIATQIDVGDSARAMSLGDRLPELVRALESRGFESPAVQVRAAAAATAPANLGSGNDAGARNDSRSPQDDGSRSQYNPFRQRSRRERDGGNQ